MQVFPPLEGVIVRYSSGGGVATAGCESGGGNR